MRTLKKNNKRHHAKVVTVRCHIHLKRVKTNSSKGLWQHHFQILYFSENNRKKTLPNMGFFFLLSNLTIFVCRCKKFKKKAFFRVKSCLLLRQVLGWTLHCIWMPMWHFLLKSDIFLLVCLLYCFAVFTYCLRGETQRKNRHGNKTKHFKV